MSAIDARIPDSLGSTRSRIARIGSEQELRLRVYDARGRQLADSFLIADEPAFTPGLAAIGVKVTHPKIRPVCWGFEQQNSVCPNAAVSVAKPRDLAATQMNVPCPVVNQDKIVPRAVHFRELDNHGPSLHERRAF